MPTLDRVFNQTKKRVIVASFASHVHRIQQILMIAEKHNRKVAFVGRSMVRFEPHRMHELSADMDQQACRDHQLVHLGKTLANSKKLSGVQA